MNHFEKALTARCELAMCRVMEAIGVDINNDALIAHTVAAYEHAHDLGLLAYKTGGQPGAIINSDPVLLKCWKEGLDDARCNEAIDHYYS